jgi:hypothetical protein
MDPDPDSDPDPVILSLAIKLTTKDKFKKSFSAYYFLKVHLHNFIKIKSQTGLRKQ